MLSPSPGESNGSPFLRVYQNSLLNFTDGAQSYQKETTRTRKYIGDRRAHLDMSSRGVHYSGSSNDEPNSMGTLYAVSAPRTRLALVLEWKDAERAGK